MISFYERNSGRGLIWNLWNMITLPSLTEFIVTLKAPNPQTGQTYSNKLKHTNCLSVFDHFVALQLKGIMK